MLSSILTRGFLSTNPCSVALGHRQGDGYLLQPPDVPYEDEGVPEWPPGYDPDIAVIEYMERQGQVRKGSAAAAVAEKARRAAAMGCAKTTREVRRLVGPAAMVRRLLQEPALTRLVAPAEPRRLLLRPRMDTRLGFHAEIGAAGILESV